MCPSRSSKASLRLESGSLCFCHLKCTMSDLSGNNLNVTAVIPSDQLFAMSYYDRAKYRVKPTMKLKVIAITGPQIKQKVKYQC
uniref:Uncharacterized protein n=1 Tax=Solanum lycopersicum TaxID=4081 RepID=A0A3Q7EWZ5_SOLLC